MQRCAAMSLHAHSHLDAAVCLLACACVQASPATATAPPFRRPSPPRTDTRTEDSRATDTERRLRRPLPLRTGTRTAASPVTVTAAPLPPPLPTCAPRATRAAPPSPCLAARVARTPSTARASARRRTGRQVQSAAAALAVPTHAPPPAADSTRLSFMSPRCSVAPMCRCCLHRSTRRRARPKHPKRIPTRQTERVRQSHACVCIHHRACPPLSAVLMRHHAIETTNLTRQTIA